MAERICRTCGKPELRAHRHDRVRDLVAENRREFEDQEAHRLIRVYMASALKSVRGE